MIVNERGHLEMADGKTTEVTEAKFYVGNCLNCISFTSLILDDGRVVLHSAIFEGGEAIEDFLYEIVERHEAIDCAETMITDAHEHLLTLGIVHDGRSHVHEWVNRLRSELVNRLH